MIRDRITQTYDVLTPGRFAGFMTVCVLATALLEEPLSIGGAVPDFVVMGLVYSALRAGADRGAVAGFGLGLFRDALVVVNFGLNAFGMSVGGYVLGKLREILYLHAPAIDILLIAVVKIVLSVLALGVAAGGSWDVFELRFFWAAPLSAVYTALLGGALHRLFERV